MAMARETSYLGKMRLLLLLFVLGTPCVIAQEGKSKLRTWTSNIGTRIEAELVSSAGEQVTLKTKTGRMLTVPINKLSKADQEFIASKPSSQEPEKGGLPIRSSFFYDIEGDAATIAGCRQEPSGALTIPATIEGKTVTSIGPNALEFCRSLTSVTFGEDSQLTSIGQYAFTHCESLASIVIPDSVTSIGEYAFHECTGLTGVTIGNGVTSVGHQAFRFCSSLTTVTFLGDAPKAARTVFSRGATPTIYRKPEAKGWGDTWGGRPVKLISEKP